jgi:truncated hemoglobin YjbI
VPHHEERYTGQELAAALSDVELSPDNAKAWERDLRRARKALKPPVNRWR